jgi:hypothetical protein
MGQKKTGEYEFHIKTIFYIIFINYYKICTYVQMCSRYVSRMYRIRKITNKIVGTFVHNIINFSSLIHLY